MNASTPMTRNVIVVSPEMPLAEAWATMQQSHVRHLLVVREGALIGILSDRDVLVRASLDRDGSAVVRSKANVGSAMTAAPFVCGPTTSVDEMVSVMTHNKIDALPVVSSDNQLLGVVTTTDLLLLLMGRP
jgi:acetoin utilization protein AcuB